MKFISEFTPLALYSQELSKSTLKRTGNRVEYIELLFNTEDK